MDIYIIYFYLSATQRKVTKEKYPLRLTPLSLQDTTQSLYHYLGNSRIA